MSNPSNPSNPAPSPPERARKYKLSVWLTEHEHQAFEELWFTARRAAPGLTRQDVLRSAIRDLCQNPPRREIGIK